LLVFKQDTPLQNQHQIIHQTIHIDILERKHLNLGLLVAIKPAKISETVTADSWIKSLFRKLTPSNKQLRLHYIFPVILARSSALQHCLDCNKLLS
jgi:uncharacterized membrane protein